MHFSSYVLVALFVVFTASPVAAQEHSPDARLLQSIYATDAPVVRVVLRGADWSAYPVFVMAPVGMWAGALATGDEYDATYRLTASEVLTLGTVSVLKRFHRRKRPYRALPGVQERMNALDRRFVNPHSSFPSGHAALSFALATSWSLSYPRVAVVAPSMGWAAVVALSRMWVGVHYPSDVLAGALVGVSAGVGVHALRRVITPAAWQETHEHTPSMRITMQVPF